MKLRQTLYPAGQANWVEHHYSGFIRVTNGEVETDNPYEIELLKSRGFTVVTDEVEPAKKKPAKAAKDEPIKDDSTDEPKELENNGKD